MSTDFREQVVHLLKEKYPSIKSQEFSLDNLISPYKVQIPQTVYDVAVKGMRELYKLSQLDSYKQNITEVDKEILGSDAKNNSLLMAYDFHLSFEGNQAKLIEVNTNASGFLFINAINHIRFGEDRANKELMLLTQSFKTEIELSGGSNKIAIIDENVFEQKMFVEFLMYKDLLKQIGFEAEIYDAEALKYEKGSLCFNGQDIGFIYNRFCDFILSEERSKDLRRSYLEKANAFSPQPREYILQADKQRLVELTKPGWIEQFANKIDVETIQSILIPSFDIHSLGTAEELWAKRKSLFFKPKNAFGAKSTYKGSSISKKVFQRLFEENSLVQEFVPASVAKFDDQEWKYDLRIFAYKGEPQAACARLFQGQVTNFKTLGGGFAAVELI